MVCTFFGHRECPEVKPHIRAVLVVLYRMPGPKKEEARWENTMLPEGIECIHQNWGGAWKYAELARKRKKRIINIDT